MVRLAMNVGIQAVFGEVSVFFFRSGEEGVGAGGADRSFEV